MMIISVVLALLGVGRGIAVLPEWRRVAMHVWTWEGQLFDRIRCKSGLLTHADHGSAAVGPPILLYRCQTATPIAESHGAKN